MLADRISTLILKYPRQIIFLCLALVMLGGIGLKNTAITIDYRAYFSGENEQFKQLKYIEDTFEAGTNVYFLLQPKDGNAFSRQSIAAVSELSERAVQIPHSYSNRVASLSTFTFSFSRNDEISIQSLIEDPIKVYNDPSTLTDDDLAFIRKQALSDEVFVLTLVDKKGSMLGVNVPLQLNNDKGLIPEITAYAENLRNEMREKYPDIDIGLSGMVMMDKTMQDLIKYDMVTIIPASYLIMVLLMSLLLRNLRGMLIIVAVLLCSDIFAIGMLGWFNTPISPPLAIAPAIILTLAVADCVHMLTNYYHHIRLGDDRETAIRASMRVNLLPVTLTSVTTAIGFLTLNFSESPPFAHLGNLVATGVMIAFFLSITMLPAILAITQSGAGNKATAAEKTMDKLSSFVINNRILLLVSTSLITLGSLWFVPKNDLNETWLDYFKDGVEFRDVSSTIGENMSGTHRIEWVMRSSGSRQIHDPKYLAFVDKFRDWCKANQENTKVRYCGSYVESIKRLHGLYEDKETIPPDHDTAAQLFFLYNNSTDTGNRVDIEESVTRFLLIAHGLNSNQVLELEQSGTQWLKENTPEHMHEIGAGVDIVFGQMAWNNIRAMLKGTGLALLLISALIMIALRSFNIGLISILPNLMPALLGFGLWAMLDGQIGLALSVVTCMTLGIVVDDTIHFLSKYLHARRDKGLSAEDSVRYVFSTVGTALLTTSVVLAGGFFVLVLSPLVPNSDLGLLAAIMILFALFADFFFLPPLLITISKWLERKAARQAAKDATKQATDN